MQALLQEMLPVVLAAWTEPGPLGCLCPEECILAQCLGVWFFFFPLFP